MSTNAVHQKVHVKCTKDKWEGLVAYTETQIESEIDIKRVRRLEYSLKVFRRMMENDEPWPGEYQQKAAHL